MYIADTIPEISQDKLDLLAERVEARRAELTQCHIRALRKNLFGNRIEFHPRDLTCLAESETQALLLALRNSFASALNHGVELCQAGLSIQSIFELLGAQWLFFMENLKNEFIAQDVISIYRLNVVEGFTVEREKVIIKEQESIRIAFEIAIERSNRIVHETQIEIQKATENNYRNIILAQEDERRKISRELHDDAGQAMVGIRMSLENLKSDLGEDADLQTKLQKTIHLTESAMLRIRSLAYSLRPPVLDLLGINLTIKQICIESAEQTGLTITYTGKETPPLSNELSISIYRIVQEALTNVIKHAKASHVWVNLISTQNSIKLTIKDDGQGFDLKTVRIGIGLESMRERSRLLGGQMEIEPRKGIFTLFKFSFPIKIDAGI